MALAAPTRHAWHGREIVGILLIVVAGLWVLLWASVWYALWELTGTEGVLMLALNPWFSGPIALGLVVLALGIRLATPPHEAMRPGELAAPRPERETARLSRVVGIVALVVAAVVALEWALSGTDEGPYPFGDVPKGDLIAYSGPGGIRLVRADGGDSWLVPGTDTMGGPVWAPDGERLAAVDLWDSGKAYSLGVDGSRRTRLPAAMDTTPEWSPDGRWLVVVEESAGGGPRIVVRPAEGGGPRVVLPMAGNDPTWSPDGKLIAFQSYAGGDVLRIYVVRRDGTGLRPLTAGTGDSTGASQAAWAPDGRRIAFTADFDGDEDIYVIGVDGTGLKKVTRNSLDDMTPTWSPNGRRLAFGRSTADLEQASIVVLDLATGAETVIAEGDLVFEPAWQPAPKRPTS
jgi:hypothetical protein